MTRPRPPRSLPTFVLLLCAAGSAAADPTPAAEVAPPPREVIAPELLRYAIPVPDHVRGLIAPGSKVDVVGALGGRQKVRAVPLVIDVLVLATDATDDGAFATATLALTEKQAEVLAVAHDRGVRAELLVRNPGRENRGYDLDDVLAMLGDLPAPQREAAPAPRPVGE